jgi:hypothetical protein
MIEAVVEVVKKAFVDLVSCGRNQKTEQKQTVDVGEE